MGWRRTVDWHILVRAIHAFKFMVKGYLPRWCCWTRGLGAVVEAGQGHGGHSHTGMTRFVRTESFFVMREPKEMLMIKQGRAEHQKSRCPASWPWTCSLQTEKINDCCLWYLDCGISLQKPCKRLHSVAVSLFSARLPHTAYLTTSSQSTYEWLSPHRFID